MVVKYMGGNKILSENSGIKKKSDNYAQFKKLATMFLKNLKTSNFTNL